MNCSSIILAAGNGTRYKAKKQDIIFHKKPLWKHVYDTANSLDVFKSIVVVGKDILGGDKRSDSVICGLRSLSFNTERVIILESARPLVTKYQIMQLVNDTHKSTSFVHPLVNTVVYRDGRYVNRSEMYDLFTPQAFDYKMLLSAYESNKYEDMTDETRVMYEHYGIKPYFIETDNNLFKVTYPGDLEYLESLYKIYCEEIHE